MKKIIPFTVVITVLLVNQVLAQNAGDKKFTSGIRGGFNTATFVEEGNKPDGSSNLKSFYVGFFNENKIVPLLHFGKGLEYMQNGMSYNSNSERILHTISIPLYLKLKIGPVYGLGGIAGDFKVSEKFTSDNGGISPADNDKSNWFDAPVFLGAGVKILFVSVEARYHWGLIEVRDGLYNRYFQIGGAISF